MRVSNRANLPDALIAAIENDPYTKGDADFSVTELIAPPRQRALMLAHKDEIELDAEDLLYALYGQIAHGILERANRIGFAEKRLFCKVDGYTVSGQLDTLDMDNGILTDWKFTTSYKFKSGEPAPMEFIAQLNMQLELLRVNGMDAQKLQIVGLLRDFSKLKAKRERDSGYPQASVVIMPIAMWPREKTQAYMRERVRAHIAARTELPLCSDEERWAKPEVWAVKKRGKKRAERLHYNEASANQHAAMGADLYVEHRPGESVRCNPYCSVRSFCAQYQQASEQAKRAPTSQEGDE